MTGESFAIASIRDRFRSGGSSPRDIVEEVIRRLDRAGDDKVWIARYEAGALRAAADVLEARARKAGIETLPLYGVPFAVKDNIDVAGLPTTAACPAFAYRPARSAAVVERLLAAGALLVAKTNLDQFATGLVGTRSPYGVPVNPFARDMIPGGSSSGSAVAVAAGLVSFALGTDTAGSGRVPAGFNNIVGLKPTRGLLPANGVVPACRSLDCVSVFALTVGDALEVAESARGPDVGDAWSREPPPGFDLTLAAPPRRFRFGVPRPAQREFFGDREGERLYAAAIERLAGLGGEPVAIDYGPLAEAASLLYGPFVAERTAEFEPFLAAHPDEIHPVTRRILEGGRGVDGLAVMRASWRLEELRAATRPIWREVDLLLVPTSPSIYSVAEVEADPVGLNTRLGFYTNFVNLLDLSALAIPNGFRGDGLPSGVTLIGPAWHDAVLAAIGEGYHRAVGGRLGATTAELPDAPPSGAAPHYPTIPLAVVGAHLGGMPRNGELLRLGARLRAATMTAPRYRLVALPDGKRPGLVRSDVGAAISVEVWDVPAAALGPFVATVQPPLAIGAVELADGSSVPGFVCDGAAVQDARDITAFGGWREYVAAAGKGPAEGGAAR